MKPVLTSLLLALPLLAAGLFTPTAQAQNIVQDPGFESANSGTGGMDYTAPDFIGDGVWQVTQGEVAVYNNSFTSNVQSHSGNQLAVLTPNFTANTLSQTLTTTPGATYTLSFFAAANNTPNTFGVTFDGVAVAGIPTSLPDTSVNGAILPSSYIEYTATGLRASSAGTILSFTASNPAGLIVLDDVMVRPSAVPAPSALLTALMGATPVLSLACRRLRRRR